MRKAWFIALFAALVFLSAGPAGASGDKQPLLTLVYTANSLGEFRECPVCGAAAQGGLGRRSTVFHEMHDAAADRTIFIAGPNEFAPMVVRKPESPDLARALAQAYGMLGYDLGVVTPQEKSWLDSAGAQLPGSWRPLGATAQTVVLQRAGLKVAVVLFPDADFAKEPAKAEQVRAAVQAEAGKARSGADVVVGVSPWGDAGEKLLLDSAPGAFDLLLGGGKGLGYGVRSTADGRTLWARPPFDGRGMVRFDILALPQGQERSWKEGENISTAVKMFDWDIPQDSVLANVFSWL